MIELTDNALKQDLHNQIFKLVSGLDYIRQELDNPDQPITEMTYSHELNDREREFFIQHLVPLFNVGSLRPQRAYVNAFHFGDTPQYHTDSEDSRARTILYYPNNVWKPMWGGETLFVPDEHEIENGLVHGICPVPNRAIMFPGTMLHTARPPVFQGLVRYSVAIKLEVV